MSSASDPAARRRADPPRGIPGLLRRLTGRPTTGQRGEALAARHLKQHGHRVLGCNLRTRFGEVDLLTLAPDGRTLVIVEVKTSAAPPGPNRAYRPEVRVDRGKQRRLIALAAQLARRHRLTQRPVRFDVIAGCLAAPAGQRVHHIPHAFASHV